MKEWAAAEKYSLTLSLPAGWEQAGRQRMELTLAIDYAGDAARVYYKDRLLTDNWYSGYRGDGALEVGLTYLAEENPGILTDGSVLELWILPLKKSTINLHENTTDGGAKVFLQQDYWPSFDGVGTGDNQVALKVNALRWVQTARVPLSISDIAATTTVTIDATL